MGSVAGAGADAGAGASFFSFAASLMGVLAGAAGAGCCLATAGISFGADSIEGGATYFCETASLSASGADEAQPIQKKMSESSDAR